jgi:hypothetical protein
MVSRLQKRGPLLLLLIAAWTVAFMSFRAQRDFWDDTFIYLHIASNIVEHWSARYFQVADSWALLASSPLRLLLVLPGVALSTLLGMGRTLQGAQLSLAVALVTSAVLAFVAGRALGRTRLGILLLIATPWLMPMFTSILQMEGALTLAGGALGFAALRSRNIVHLGAVFVGLAFARLELGVAFLAATAVLALGDRDLRRSLVQWRGTRTGIGGALCWIAIPLVVWVALAASWKVWPIPVTYLLKAITAEVRLLSGFVYENIGDKFLEWLRITRIDPKRTIAVNSIGMALAGAFVVAVGLPLGSSPGSARSTGRVARSVFLGVYFIIVCRGANTFVWYHENVALAFVGAILEVLDTSWARQSMPRRLAAVMGVALAAQGAYVNGKARKRYHEDFSDDPTSHSIGNLYRRLGQNHDPASPLLSHPALGPYVLYTCEIGTIAYFGDNVWFRDNCGLAQGGDLTHKHPTPLTRLYPHQALHTGDEELNALIAKYKIQTYRTVGYNWNGASEAGCLEYGKPAYPGGWVCFIANPN